MGRTRSTNTCFGSRSPASITRDRRELSENKCRDGIRHCHDDDARDRIGDHGLGCLYTLGIASGCHPKETRVQKHDQKNNAEETEDEADHIADDRDQTLGSGTTRGESGTGGCTGKSGAFRGKLCRRHNRHQNE